MIINERDSREERALEVAKKMLTAARTAPKGRGFDAVEAAIVTGDDIFRLSAEMMRLHEATGKPVYHRDSENIKKAQAIVIIGTKYNPLGLNCGNCGFPTCILLLVCLNSTCAEKPTAAPCAVSSVDVGIALGSAVAMAADMRVDTRIMFSVGMAAKALDILGSDVTQVYAIPISISSKNPFFDR